MFKHNFKQIEIYNTVFIECAKCSRIIPVSAIKEGKTLILKADKKRIHLKGKGFVCSYCKTHTDIVSNPDNSQKGIAFERMAAILDLLRDRRDGLTVQEIAKLMFLSRQTIHKYLDEMIAAGVAYKQGTRGVRSDVYHFMRRYNDSLS